jgi:signal transduction histidine kinase
MKLLTKTSTYYLYASVILLIVFGGLLFLVLKKDISDEIKEQLDLQVTMIAEEIGDGHVVNYPLTIIEKTNTAKPGYFRDTVIFDHYQHINEGYYALTENRRINNVNYAITVMTTYIGWDAYFKTIGFVFVALGILLVVSGFMVNLLVSRKIWRPFLNNLSILKGHVLSSSEPLILQGSDTNEFKDLNEVLLDFAERSRNEYLGLQEFTENSSHELQTPISIIRSRLENLAQLSLQNEGARYVQEARDAVTRLSRVNKGLLLLARLSGTQFPDVTEVVLPEVLSAHIKQLDELFHNRGIQLQTSIAPCIVKASPYLVDILVSNLLSNQLKYTTGNHVSITLQQNKLELSNEAEPLPFPESVLFARFVKGDARKAGTGLGLSIAKKICTVHNWEINHRYDDGKHIFTVNFGALNTDISNDKL